MANMFSSGKFSIAMCDRCGQQFKLKQLKYEVIKTKLYQLKVCDECWICDANFGSIRLGLRTSSATVRKYDLIHDTNIAFNRSSSPKSATPKG